jgi:hypothetical protein
LPAFLLEDLRGAISFHPILSAVIGVDGGVIGHGISRLLALLQWLFPSKGCSRWAQFSGPLGDSKRFAQPR